MLLCVLCTSMLAGCANKTENESPNVDSVTEEVNVDNTPPVKEVKELTPVSPTP